jgi:hypothetical protein
MFMRYFGGGIGHLSQLPGMMNRDAMDVDPPSSEANLSATANLTPNESGHLTYELELLVEQAISSNPDKGSEALDVATSDQDDDDEGVDASDDSGADDDDSDRSASESDDDLGPEDGEGIGDGDSDEGYASP